MYLAKIDGGTEIWNTDVRIAVAGIDSVGATDYELICNHATSFFRYGLFILLHDLRLPDLSINQFFAALSESI